MIIEIYDIEVLVNLFTYTGYDRTTGEWFQFVIHKSKNQYRELMAHLFRSKDFVQVGFNNVNYDYPVLHHLINHYDEYKDMDANLLTSKIYTKSQEVIDAEFSAIADKNVFIPQIDVYRINHWDSAAKACSLKHCEVAMRMDVVEDMPLHHTHWVFTQTEIDMILRYNKHDVKATDMVFDYCLGKVEHAVYKGKNKLELRQVLSKKYNINLLNYNDVKIGETLLLKLYCKATGLNEYHVKKMGTPRNSMDLKECIPAYVKFSTQGFQKLHNNWKKKTIYQTKKAIEDTVIYHGIKLQFGTGGIHGSNKGIFTSDDYWTIIDSDVALIEAQVKLN